MRSTRTSRNRWRPCCGGPPPPCAAPRSATRPTSPSRGRPSSAPTSAASPAPSDAPRILRRQPMPRGGPPGPTAGGAPLGGVARRAACWSPSAPADVIRLSAAYDVELVLLPAPDALDAAPLAPDLAEILERSAASIAVVSGGAADWTAGAGGVVPVGGAEDDWAPLQLAASLAPPG